MKKLVGVHIHTWLLTSPRITCPKTTKIIPNPFAASTQSMRTERTTSADSGGTLAERVLVADTVNDPRDKLGTIIPIVRRVKCRDARILWSVGSREIVFRTFR